MAVGSDNVFPKLILSEGAAPATPAAGQTKLYAKADGLLYSKDDAGAETPLGGGGGAPTTTKYIVSAADAGLSAEIVIPWLAGSPDIKTAGGSDDEFDTTSAGVPTGWTATANAVTAQDTNTSFLSQYYVSAPNAGADRFYGIYKAAPSIPYTVTAKLSDSDVRANYNGVNLGICDATDLNGKAVVIQLQCITYPGLSVGSWATFVPGGGGNSVTFGSIASQADVHQHAPLYLRAIVTAANNVTYEYSHNGYIWVTFAASNAYLATAGTVFIGVDPNGLSTKAAFDWVRFI